MADNHLISIVKQIAAEYNLPGDVVCGIVETESNWNPFAARYEPAFYVRYVPATPPIFGLISRETERVLRATSFGLMQVMGQTARDMGCKLPFLTALVDADTGVDYGCKYLAKQRDRWLGQYGWDGVIASYNSGTPIRDKDTGKFMNQVYVTKVRLNAKKYV